MGQKKTVVISDIHMGTNTYPNWYRNDIHNPYLKHILNWVIQNKDQENIDELIILGDLFDFWTCPPDQTPPTATDIINHNSGILGEGGLLSQVLTALNGNVSYLRGNHDITITKNDINKIGNPGENIKFQPDIYVKDGVVYTHGHLFTMFNAPPFNEPPFDPKTPRDYKTVLPVGHFVTRAVSYSLQQKNHEEAAHEPGFGAPHMGFNALKSLLPPWPDSITEIPSFIEALIKLFDPSDFSFVDEFLKAVQGTTGTTDDTRFQLKDGLYSVDKNGNHQDFVTFAQVKEDYQSLWTEWVDRYKFGDDWRKSVERGSLYAYKAAWADYDGSYLGWYAQQLAFEKNADLVVMGHTHIPKRGLDEGVVDYINSGFECVPTPDMKKGQKMTYSIITTENGKLVSSKSKVMDIAEDGTSSNDNPPKAMVFGGTGSDYSCYITVENNTDELYLLIQNSIQQPYGAYSSILLNPILPKEIPAKGKIQFWLQDFPGPTGSEGGVKYHCQKSGQELHLTFTCPFNKAPIIGSPNQCSGTNEFYTQSNSFNPNGWGNKNHIEKKGNPFFVKFVIN